MKIIYNLPAKSKSPNWALYAMAFFPYNVQEEYNDDDADHMMGEIESYLNKMTYRRRSAIVKLGDTHWIKRKGNTITVMTVARVPYLEIKLIGNNLKIIDYGKEKECKND